MNVLAADIDFLLEEIEKAPCTPPRELISEYAAEKRILPPNTPFPGLWDNDKTPYLVEIMDNMSPHSPVTRTVLLKGVQLGATAAAENVMGYYMDEFPTEILYISATDRLLQNWGQKRLEPLIDSCGFRHKIYSQSTNKGSRRTGDKIMVKEFVGGTLNMASAQSASSLRSDSKRVLIRDEIDGAPVQLRTGEGDWVEVSDARTNAWGARKKILDFSTPTTLEVSKINPLYLNGDQRKYLVPCPFCGKAQELKFGSKKSEYGLKPEMKAGVLIDAYYQCEFCREAIFNYHKTEMLKKGIWEPTATPVSVDYRSYHISSLYSPVGMLSWLELYQKYLAALREQDGMRSFVNLCLGKAYKESGYRPKLENVIELRGGYQTGEVPDGVLYITAGIDVQAGSKKDPNNPPRLEMEVCGHGADWRTWSIIYRRFEGEVDDPFAGAWKDLYDWICDSGFVFRKKDSAEYVVQLALIDSGDGNLTNVVYQFCRELQNVFPSKGFSALKKRRHEKGDEMDPSNFKRYRTVKINPETHLIEMSTNFYKTNTYNNLNKTREVLGEQKPGFPDFPIDYPETYFKMLTAEEKWVSDGSFHCSSGVRNEALDCRVMNLCAGDVYLDRKLNEYKAAAKAAGASELEIGEINHKHVLELLKRG